MFTLGYFKTFWTERKNNMRRRERERKAKGG